MGLAGFRYARRPIGPAEWVSSDALVRFPVLDHGRAGRRKWQLFLATQITTSATAAFDATNYAATTTEAQKSITLPFAVRITDGYVICDALRARR